MSFQSINDYKNYINDFSLDQLIDIKLHIDKEKYPDRYELVINEIELKKSAPNNTELKIDGIHILSQKPLPTLNIIKHTISLSWEIKSSLLRVLTIPYIIMILLESSSAYMVTHFSIVASLVMLTLRSLVYALLVVSCHRLILLGSSSILKFGRIIPGIREIRFWGWTILFSLITYIVVIIPTVIMIFTGIDPKNPSFFLAPILSIYLLSRWTLIFPAVAVDQHPSPDWAWAQSKNNGLRLFMLLLIPLLPIYGMNKLITDDSSLLLNGVVILLTFIFAVIGIILISLSYKELCLQKDAEN